MPKNSIPQVSIVIPCYNCHKWIELTLNSVFEQVSVNLQVIVVDDGSTDQSRTIIERKFPSVKLIKTANQGASAARNRGTSFATGAFIQYLDADDLLMPGKLQKQLDLLEKTQADVAYGDWERIFDKGEGKFATESIVSRQIEDDPEIALFTDFWCPPAVYLMRRSIVEKVGNWNTNLPIIQDARFALDCALYGGNFVYLPEVVAKYRVHGAGLSQSDPIAFVRDIYTNAREVDEWWQQNGGITDKRKDALVQVYGYVSHATFKRDPETFEKAYAILRRLTPRYIPKSPRHYKYSSYFIGFKNTEHLAYWYRQIKSLFKNVLHTPTEEDK
jgi:glycosyltransferase involved in cell wall biosynthesis